MPIQRYAATEAEERKLLASLSFVGPTQAAYVRDLRHPIEWVRSELHRVYPKKMGAFDAEIEAQKAVNLAAAKAATAQAVAIATHAKAVAEGNLSGRGPELDEACGLNKAEAPRGVVNMGRLQIFGA